MLNSVSVKITQTIVFTDKFLIVDKSIFLTLIVPISQL